MTHWNEPIAVEGRQYTCAFCGSRVGPARGYAHKTYKHHFILLCPTCDRPTYFEGNHQTPAPLLGNDVKHVPTEIYSLYNEARACTGAKAYTAAVLACRKILMHIAVDKGATPGAKFIEYVEYLGTENYVPHGSEGWVDHIRKKGNEANHEIAIMAEADALDLINFIEMLLKLVYEFPGRIPKET